MPTDETPSAGAVAREIVKECAHMPARVDPILPVYIEGACAGCITLALDAFARKREVAAWEEAAKVLDKCSAVIPVSTADESIYAAQLAIKVALTAIGIELRTRAAEARGTP